MNDKIKKRNKVEIITDSWAKYIFNKDVSDYISDEELEFRRKSCNECAYNSVNSPKESLNILEQAYGKVMGDYCTICLCPIGKKILAPTEECAIGQRGRKPIWNRTAIITTSDKNINIVNRSPRKINVDANETEYIIYVDHLCGDLTFSISIESKDFIDSITNLRSNCPCIKVLSKNVEDRSIHSDIKMVYQYLPNGYFEKFLYVGFKTVNNSVKRIGIKIIGSK